MSVVVAHNGGRTVYAKGAPDVLLESCNYMLWENKIIPLTGTLRRKAEQAAESMARSALRVLGMAYRDFTPAHAEAEEKSQADGPWLCHPDMRDMPAEESDARAAAGFVWTRSPPIRAQSSEPTM